MNEGGCDPDGRFYCGSMAYDQRPGAGSLYRLDPDGVGARRAGRTSPSPTAWSGAPTARAPTTSTPPTGRVDVFDYDRERGLTGRRPFARPADGHPDGLTVDAEGGVWVALYGGGAVHRYTPEGALDAVVELPDRTGHRLHPRRPGPGPAVRHHVGREPDPGADPLAGALFAADVGVGGRPVREFAG